MSNIPIEMNDLYPEEADISLDLLDQPGDLDLAKIHGKVQRMYKYSTNSSSCDRSKKDEIKLELKYCSCCSLPEPEAGAVEPYKFCINTKELMSCGPGIVLYFHFYKYVVTVLLFIFTMVSVPMMITSHRYYNELIQVCDLPRRNDTICDTHYNLTGYRTWLFSLSQVNQGYYRKLQLSLNSDLEFKDTSPDYSLISFVCMIIIFVFSLFMISNMKLITKEVDYCCLTPSDYTVIISGITKNYKDQEQLRTEMLKIVTHRVIYYIRKILCLSM